MHPTVFCWMQLLIPAWDTCFWQQSHYISQWVGYKRRYCDMIRTQYIKKTLWEILHLDLAVMETVACITLCCMLKPRMESFIRFQYYLTKFCSKLTNWPWEIHLLSKIDHFQIHMKERYLVHFLRPGYPELMSLVHFKVEYLSDIWTPTGVWVLKCHSVLWPIFDSCLRIILCSVDTWVLVSTELGVK